MHRLLASMAIILGMTVVTGGLAAAAGSTPESSVRRPAAQTEASNQAALDVPPSEARIVLYGDSLASEAEPHFRDALAAAGVADVKLSTFGGTAICDWLDDMRVDAATIQPTAVVVEFSGNAITPCMTDLSGQSLAADTASYHQKYLVDAREVLAIFAPTGTRVYFAGAPITRKAEETKQLDPRWLNQLYAGLADDADDDRYVDAGQATLLDDQWTATLPCLPAEPCTGGVDADGTPVNVVRAPDGGHFCPGAPDANRGVTEECPVWSSGAYRFGSAMAAPVLEDLGVTIAKA
jgi:hypothetical protein